MNKYKETLEAIDMAKFDEDGYMHWHIIGHGNMENHFNNIQEALKLASKQAIKKGTQIPLDVDQDTWKEFVEQRKRQKATVSNTAINKIRKQAESVGWTLQEAVEEMLARGWRGFSAEWVEPKVNRKAEELKLTSGMADWKKQLCEYIDATKVEMNFKQVKFDGKIMKCDTAWRRDYIKTHFGNYITKIFGEVEIV